MLYSIDEKLCKQQYKLEAKIKRLKAEIEDCTERNNSLIDKIKAEVEIHVKARHAEFMKLAHEADITLLDYADRVEVKTERKDRHQLPSEANGWKYELAVVTKCYIDGKLVFEY